LATANYECLFLFDSNHYARDPGGVAATVQDMITNAGGEILVSRLWAEQRLAFPIDGHNKGTYWLVIFKLDTLKLKEIRKRKKSEPTKSNPLVSAMLSIYSGNHKGLLPAGPLFFEGWIFACLILCRSGFSQQNYF